MELTVTTAKRLTAFRAKATVSLSASVLNDLSQDDEVGGAKESGSILEVGQ